MHPVENDSSISTETNCLYDAMILVADSEDQDILKIIRVLGINKWQFSAWLWEHIITYDKGLWF